MTERHALYPGTFDPITVGHLDVLRRALRIFERVTVAVAEGGRKTLFDTAERVDLARAAVMEIGADDRVDVISFDGLLVDALRVSPAGVVVRGLRTPGDLEHEQPMAALNRSLDPGFEVVTFFARPELVMVSATLVRDVARCGGDVTPYVPAAAAAALRARFAGGA